MALTPFSVVLAEYDPAWPQSAAELIRQLHAAVSQFTTIHHIGSTAIPGMLAKPIIDMMPVVARADHADQCRAGVESLGYSWHGEFGISGRRYCKLEDASGTRIAQLHIFDASSRHVMSNLVFRDYMRAHHDAARAYEAEKRRARDLHPHSSRDYAEAKSQWIAKVLIEAERWYEDQPKH